MLSWLKKMIHPDQEISFFNDTALKIAPGYNQIFDYLKSGNKTNELTSFWIESCEGVKEDYSLARKYFRSALNWDENSSEATKTFKREMKDNINKIEDDIIPLLEDILK